MLWLAITSALTALGFLASTRVGLITLCFAGFFSAVLVCLIARSFLPTDAIASKLTLPSMALCVIGGVTLCWPYFGLVGHAAQPGGLPSRVFFLRVAATVFVFLIPVALFLLLATGAVIRKLTERALARAADLPIDELRRRYLPSDTSGGQPEVIALYILRQCKKQPGSRVVQVKVIDQPKLTETWISRGDYGGEAGTIHHDVIQEEVSHMESRQHPLISYTASAAAVELFENLPKDFRSRVAMILREKMEPNGLLQLPSERIPNT